MTQARNDRFRFESDAGSCRLFDHLAEDVLARDSAEHAAVHAVVAVVTHDKILIFADDNKFVFPFS